MKISAEIISEKPCTISGFGYLKKNTPQIYNEFTIVRAESRYKRQIGDFNWPESITFTLLVETDDVEKE